MQECFSINNKKNVVPHQYNINLIFSTESMENSPGLGVVKRPPGHTASEYTHAQCLGIRENLSIGNLAQKGAGGCGK